VPGRRAPRPRPPSRQTAKPKLDRPIIVIAPPVSFIVDFDEPTRRSPSPGRARRTHPGGSDAAADAAAAAHAAVSRPAGAAPVAAEIDAAMTVLHIVMFDSPVFEIVGWRGMGLCRLVCKEWRRRLTSEFCWRRICLSLSADHGLYCPELTPRLVTQLTWKRLFLDELWPAR